MNTTSQGLIKLLKSAVTGEKYELPADFDLEQAYAMSRTHHMAPLIYAGAVNCGVQQNHPAMQKLFQIYCKAMMVSERQMKELQRLIDALEARGLDYMPLKGSMMKALYPKPELRMMGDADILIRQEQYERIVPVMQQLGFAYDVESDCHYVWKSSSLCVELHQRMVPEYYAELSRYYGTGWDFARLESGTRYAMSPEDTFVFLFTHFAKHFMYSGVGCRHVVDLWVYRRCHTDLDETYMEKQLETMQLHLFYRHVRRMLSAWFEEGRTDDVTDRMTEYIMRNGSWGSQSTRMVNESVRGEEAKTGRMGVMGTLVMKAAYPGANVLRKEYPVLEKAPVLLPAIAVFRLIKKICSPVLVRNKVKNFRQIDQKKIDTQRELMELFGLKES